MKIASLRQCVIYFVTMNKKTLFRVLACLDLSSEAGRQKLGGIYRFLSQGYMWDLSLIRSQKEFDGTFRSRIAEQSYDGLLIAVPEDAGTRRLHATIRTPTAFIDYVDKDLLRDFGLCVFVHDDDRDIGRCAAQRLLKQGPFNSYAYAASSDPRPWNAKRGKLFAQSLALRKIRTSVLKDADTRPIESIARWLAALPKPTGILAAYDDAGRRILNACRAAKLQVPSDVSVLGIGNDELVCTHTSPQLSSIIPDFEGEGYRAARELQALMLRRRHPAQTEFLCGCKGIVSRGSTAGEFCAAILVQQAIAFIRENAFNGITAADVVRQLHVSRRLADLRFREITGTSILAYITDIRLEKVKRMLIDTDLRMEEIARHCGYTAGNLKNLFARHFHCSMRTYRRGKAYW